MQSAQTRYLDRSEGRIAYDDSASPGQLAVLMPSLGDVRQEYRFLAPRLVAAGYRVVTMDLRGHGESSTGWSDYSPEALGADALALVEYLDAGPAVLIGTSISGGSAAWAAAERPDLVSGAVLIGASVRSVRVPLPQELVFKALLMRPWGPAAWSTYYKSLFPATPPADLDAYRAALTANVRERGRLEALSAMAWVSRDAVERRLGEVRVPTLVLFGSRDPDFKDPAGEARLIAERLGGTRAHIELIEGAGHYPHAEMPDETAARILTFLEGLRPAPGIVPAEPARTLVGAYGA